MRLQTGFELPVVVGNSACATAVLTLVIRALAVALPGMRRALH
jgi:hypothetical protein